jgi:hypothetical protein
MDTDTLKAIGTLFLAIINSLTDNHRTEISAAIARAANNPEQPPECREFYKALHHAATGDLEQLVLETERMRNNGRPRLEVVAGDGAA